MTRSFWIFEVFLAVAGVLAGLIFHCIFKFYVNPQMQDINWTWMGFITVTMLIAGFPAWLAAKKTSWLRLTVLTNVFNYVLLALVPLWYIAFGSDGMEKTLAWYFSAAWALSGVESHQLLSCGEDLRGRFRCFEDFKKGCKGFVIKVCDAAVFPRLKVRAAD